MGNLSAGDSARKLGLEQKRRMKGFLSLILSEKFARHVKAWTTEILWNICVHSTRYTRVQSLNRLNWESNSRWLKILGAKKATRKPKLAIFLSFYE